MSGGEPWKAYFTVQEYIGKSVVVTTISPPKGEFIVACALYESIAMHKIVQ